MTTNDRVSAEPSSKTVYSIADLASVLGVHRATISSYINSGELKALRLGHRTVRVTHESLMEFLRAKEAETLRDLEARGANRGKRGGPPA